MNKILLDTSASLLNACILKENGEKASISLRLERNANEKVLHAVNYIIEGAGCKISDINEFYVVNGPGSYTGVRIGVATLLGMADALGRKLRGVSTLDAFALTETSRNFSLAYKVRKNMYVLKKYDFEKNVFSDYTTVGESELIDGVILINDIEKSLSEALFHKSFDVFTTEYAPNYFRKSEAEINYDERSKA